MKNRPTIRNAMLVAALAAVTATAWATSVAIPDSTWVPAPQAAPPTTTPLVQEPPVLTEGETVVADPLPSTERVMPIEAAAIPRIERREVQPPVVVEQRRLTLDERIQANVMDKLAQAPNLSGKIGVESHDAVVTLSGYTTTAGQAQRAGRYARGVEGVKYVQNEIRSRVGGSI